MERLRAAGGDLAEVPVIVVVRPGALEDGLRGAIEGAVRCLAEPIEPDALVAALDAALAPDAPPPAEQRRVSRQRALGDAGAHRVARRRRATPTCTRGWCT